MKTAYDIIIKPIITEQSMEATEEKKYVFQVAVDANKIEIKKAVEEIFGEGRESQHHPHGRQGKAHGRSRWPPRQLEEGNGQADRRFQDHRVLRGYGLIERRVTRNVY